MFSPLSFGDLEIRKALFLFVNYFVYFYSYLLMLRNTEDIDDGSPKLTSRLVCCSRQILMRLLASNKLGFSLETQPNVKAKHFSALHSPKAQTKRTNFSASLLAAWCAWANTHRKLRRAFQKRKIRH